MPQASYDAYALSLVVDVSPYLAAVRAATDPGAIGAGNLWVDTSPGYGQWIVRQRNASNDGWQNPVTDVPNAITGDVVAIVTLRALGERADDAEDRLDALEAAAPGFGVTIATHADGNGATRTFALADANRHWRFTNNLTSTVTATLPPNSAVAFPVGTLLTMEQAGTAALHVAAGAGVTLNVAAAHGAQARERYAVVQAAKVAADVWTLYGNLAEAP